MTTKRSLKEWRDIIKREAPGVDIKPYSHNIISIALQAIASQWSPELANQAIDDFKLETRFGKGRGWSKLSPDEYRKGHE
jgi:hypothetical protein